MSALPYQPGEKVFFKTPYLTSIVTFIAVDEGWASVQFSDESFSTVRPSYVSAIDMTAFNVALAEYERRLDYGEGLLIDHIHGICHEIQKELGIEHSEKLQTLDRIGRELTPLPHW